MIVVDLGSAITRVLNTKNGQQVSVPTVVGFTTNPRVVLTADHKTIFVGTEAMKNRAFLTLQHPIQYGRVQDMEALEIFVAHLFYYELKVWPKKVVMLVHSSFNQRQRLAQVLFEKLGVQMLQFQLPGVVHLLKENSQTALCFDAADSGTESFALYNGEVFQQSVQWNDLGGRNFSEQLAQKIAFPAASESDFSLIQEHFYGLRNELKVSDQMRNDFLNQLKIDCLLTSIAELPLISRAKAAKHLVVCGGLAKFQQFRAVFLKKLQESKAPYAFQIIEAGEPQYQLCEQLDKEWLWMTKDNWK